MPEIFPDNPAARWYRDKLIKESAEFFAWTILVLVAASDRQVKEKRDEKTDGDVDQERKRALR